jgi:hypothetical protein
LESGMIYAILRPAVFFQNIAPFRPQIRKGQPCWSAHVRRSVCCTASFSVCSLRPTKLPIIYPDLRLD